MRGLADPEHFFLDLCHSFETAFNRQIASRDHHTESGGSHRLEDQGRQLIKGPTGFDFKNDSGRCFRQFVQAILKARISETSAQTIPTISESLTTKDKSSVSFSVRAEVEDGCPAD
jgi:hypothetical protein